MYNYTFWGYFCQLLYIYYVYFSIHWNCSLTALLCVCAVLLVYFTSSTRAECIAVPTFCQVFYLLSWICYWLLKIIIALYQTINLSSLIKCIANFVNESIYLRNTGRLHICMYHTCITYVSETVHVECIYLS